MSGAGLPLPIPWLGVVGEVPSLDGSSAAPAPVVIAKDLVAPMAAAAPTAPTAPAA
ncbi:MAG: hypothetical protein JWM10_540, partial [Myxococcaceae bacterium]|nr:hypothetical protein [Myxococcaceae bacterium]